MAEAALSHVAIIPDGNRRWAAMKGVSRYEGHMAGANRIHDVVAELIKLQVKYLTLWGFSTDNWKRTPEEIQDIFALLQLWIEKDTPWLHEKGVRLRHIGRFHQLPLTLQHAIGRAVDLTAHNEGMTLNLAFNYTGRAEIIDAVRRLIDSGELFLPEMCRPELDEKLFSRYLYTDGMPDVDLVIRTADEFRLSNFMLWQTAYSEFYFTEALWPDFDAIELEKALQAYTERKRRFGGD
jgi:undecaprenyl diphosphate synthase